MKFGKEFTAQMVPEWEDAYMNYNHLKGILKEILRSRPEKMAAVDGVGEKRGLKRRRSLYRAFSGLTNRNKGEKKSEDETILVSRVQGEGLEWSYQTMFLKAAEDGGAVDREMVFFRRIDGELNKVEKFYRKKVEEVEAEAGELTKQMNALIALRIKVENPAMVVGGGGRGGGGGSVPLAPMGRPVNGGQKPSGEGWLQMDTIEEEETSRKEDEENRKNHQIIGKSTAERAEVGDGFKSPPLEILDHVKINVEPETPLLTLKGLLPNSKSHLSFSKDELRKAEDQMMTAFVEFYHKLPLLKSYSFLNILAFSKIMKKYDKINGRSASKAYMDTVENSYIGNSDEVNRLIERVEATFVKHFANGNHRKGMNLLRPIAKKERHRITFLLGCFFGCSIALIIAIGMAIHARDLLSSPEGRNQYMANIFPLYSLFVYIMLHMIMYALNIFYWKRYRVNYPFIFGFKQGTELGYREVLLVTSAISVLTLAGIASNLEMEMDHRTKSFQAITELVPLLLVIILLVVLFCPFNIIYRSSRYFLIGCLFHSICAPLYKVTLPDFFMADQLTSQVQALRSLNFYVCYYGWGDFKRRVNTCKGTSVFDTFHLVIAILPYWLRFIQCVRRLFEEKDIAHGLNGLKYLSTIVAVALRTIHELNTGITNLKIMALVSSAIATLVNTYWDIVVDWGLLRRNSENPWLRDKLLVPNKSVYFVAMIMNIILRLAWMQTVLGYTEAPFLHRKAVIAIVACLEILRRGIWNFFRLENEHLNNVGKYRAFKSVPLPFNYDDDGAKNT